MIVELIGATGAGKSTLARELLRRGLESGQVRMATDLVTDRPGRRWVENPHAVNLLADAAALPPFLRSFDDHRDFVRFAFERLRHHAPSTFAKANYLRNVVRKVGVHELTRRADPAVTFLNDEGTVLIAYQLFVYSDAAPTPFEIERFARLVPLPDLVVHVKAPTDLLVGRAMTRPDVRRELAGLDGERIGSWIGRAISVFDALAGSDAMRDRVLTIELADESPEGLDRAVEQLRDAVETRARVLDASTRSTLDGRSGASRRATVIAFVGSEATGKSTVLDEVERWLSTSRRVRRVHAGKPPSTPLTSIPHALLPALRSLFPEQRTLRVEERYEGGDATGTTYPLLFGIRSVMLAYERRALLRRAVRDGAGTVVLSDRYPSDASGAPDGPQLTHLPMPKSAFSLRRILAAIEGRLYRDIPTPDLVFQLTAPLEVTLARNAAREKKEPEEYVRFRHELSSRLRFDGASVYPIDTDRDLDQVVREVEVLIDARREV
jgi:thymidylate kinase